MRDESLGRQNPLDRHLAPWIYRGRRLTRDRFADARAHAATGNLQAAGDRLTELQESLVGGRIGKTNGLLHDARTAFARASVGLHRRDLPPEALASIEVTPELEESLRQARIGPGNPLAEISGLVGDAYQQLRGLSSLSTATGQPADLAGWEDRHIQAVLRRLEGALSDSQTALHTVLGHLMVRPEYR
jgi:hypothetical protein